MRAFRTTVVSIAAGLALLLPKQAHAQATATVVPGPTYGAGALKRALLGGGWRELWATPVTAPLFDIDSFAGGLKIDKQGGGFQTITLHLTEQNGWKEYRFRSVDKYPELHLPPAIAGTIVGRLIEDQTGNLFPAAGLIVPPFIDAVGGLQVVPSLYVMKDKPSLGKYRQTFAGMLGTVELKGEEAPDDKPGFAGSNKIKGTDGFLEDIRESRAHRLDERELLAIRLIDFLINDTDRTPDNLDWARFGEDGNYLWRPLARDRDRAFTNGSGVLNALFVRRVYPKFTRFNSKYSIRGLMSSSYAIDRPLLQRLTAQDFADVARQVQASVSDSVIAASLALLPAEWANTERATKLRETLIERRAGLVDAAMKFYADLATDPDIYLTGDNERVEIMRHENGQVTVTVPGTVTRPKIIAEAPNAAGGATRVMPGDVDGPTPAFYKRTFLPSETDEIRIFLGKGNDTAVVRGASTDAIRVRVIGEEGDDVLADSVRGGAEFFYDSEGKNQFLKRGTHVSERPWTPPEQVFGFTIGGAWRPDWGERTGWRPHFKYGEGAGLIIGAGPRITSYGFRHLPYHWKADAALLYGTGNGRLGVTTNADWRAENSPLGFTVAARATELDAFRFYGYGNDTPDIGRDLSLVQQRVVAAEPALTWQVGWRKRESAGKILHDFSEGSPYDKQDTMPSVRRAVVGMLKVGPLFMWTDPQPAVAGPLSSAGGGNSFAHYGAGFSVDLDGTDTDPVPTLGWKVRANFSGYPIGIRNDGFTTSSGAASAYLPLGLGGSTVAFRVGGALASGDYPAQYAAFVGGSSTVRGYSWHRFAGDVAAIGSTELRVPVGTLNFLLRSDVGLIALADAGRVWVDEQSAGGWHTSLGGGLWFAALGKALSVTYARGEEGRFYLKTGLPF
jgi:hypothetical protein